MSHLIEIQNQIAELQKQADEIKSREFAQTVEEIKGKMATYGITLADLDTTTSRKRSATTKSDNPAPVKFRGPTGETWSGRGLMPRWLAAFVAEGKNREDFAI